MASKVSICNLALLRIGAAQIQDITESSNEAYYCNAFYDDVRKEVLRDHPWNFATAVEAPALLSNEEPPDWTYAFRKPSGCLRLLKLLPAADLSSDNTTLTWAEAIASSQIVSHPEVSDDTIEYELRGLNILTNSEDIVVKYIDDIEDPTMFDDSFVAAFSYRLAADLAMPITEDGGKQTAMMDTYERMLHKGKGADAKEGRKTRKTTFLDARN